MPEFRSTVLLQGSDGRFLGRITGGQAETLWKSGLVVRADGFRDEDGSRKPLKVIRFAERLVDERGLKGLGQDSRKSTYRQTLCEGGVHVPAMKRVDRRTGGLVQDGRI